ncbi:Cytochrome c oxidase copper chaperone [Mortierella polycephala]|uniref:Cytochrome c oxidase copper chaperone n=1 Tax=Mortierella polycephala TaxID=41804 RepID=A0A9P6PN83_9FUNG|nr:Cytochrome c oxidase copper chaperone [Mortierella polycephala]
MSVTATPAPATTASTVPIGKDGKPLKPCCACPETKKVRDNCVFNNGEENCLDLIKAHQQCLRDLGFKI